MKFSEMDSRQKKATINVKNAANDLLGGLENTLSDYTPDTEEYKAAKATLSNHKELVETLYRNATTNIYRDGSVWFSKEAQKAIKDIRFCGKEWLMERCEKRITNEGY